ncbi:xaa-Pro aminopeptidase 1 [Lepeophtheirus salmonis]|uniref:xaa-Pro aminopeptidase 1 n=1 Tax=Lepeophtheirus salmonis TaxID=72036 RepID=UPI001AE90317|nr:xaa-Pro aminopeptidase 1-like [Lepeophtheirus salmonis]
MIHRQIILSLLILGTCFHSSFGDEDDTPPNQKEETSTSMNATKACSSKNQIPSTEQLKLLRGQMEENGIVAYLIPMDNDKRIQWISGFSGSQAKVVVTLSEAALWTDGRYFLQASNQLDCNWRLVKEGEPDEPSISSWIKNNLDRSDKVGSDPNLLGAKTWLQYMEELGSIELESIDENLIDSVRTDNYTIPEVRIVEHPLEFAGKERNVKIEEIRKELDEKEYDGMVVTEEDEIAWLFNLRGEKEIDINNMVNRNPTFKSLVYLPTLKNETIYLWCDLAQFEDISILTNDSSLDLEIEDIDDAHASLSSILADNIPQDSRILIPSKSVYKPGSPYSIYKIASDKGHLDVSPIIEAKSIKNPTEIKGMKASHERDAVALIEFVSFLEDCIVNKEERNWTEINAAQTLFQIRSKKKFNKGLSFGTISAFGSNGAIIHYRPEENTNKVIDNSSLYLLDSGGQYLDGTTDVTRTFHFGSPTDNQIQMYTRVLAAAIDIASVVAPVGVIDRNIDYAARKHFYNIGKDYRHGTGHGIGSYLNVHEGHTRLAMEKTGSPIKPGMFFSDEPGYYEDGKFGIRLETILQAVKNPDLSNNNPYGDFLNFEPVSLVPFEPKLIDKTYLTISQREWLNDYNALLNTTIAPLLEHDELAHEYLMSRISENYLE